MRATIQQVIRDIEKYVDQWNNRRDEIPYEIKTSIITQIIRTKSIDTTRFIRAIDFREEGMGAHGYRYLIDSARDSEMTYDGFVEFDGITRNFVGRFNYRDGIKNSRLKPIFDSYADTSFAR